MDKIIKHSFEAVSLLTKGNGMLDVTIIPAMNQPDWMIPSTLILEVNESKERMTHYAWQEQQVVVFSLLPKGQIADKTIIIEGNTASHRIALQTIGELRQMQVRISQVTDVDTQQITDNDYFDINKVDSYSFQTVVVDGESLMVPDLDKITYHLGNLNDIEVSNNTQ